MLTCSLSSLDSSEHVPIISMFFMFRQAWSSSGIFTTKVDNQYPHCDDFGGGNTAASSVESFHQKISLMLYLVKKKYEA